MLFIYSKFIELVDTVWLALKKRPMTLLHVWHHITVLLYCWHSYATRIGTGLWFAAMNYLVHTVMYTYFGATSISPTFRKAVRCVMITLLFTLVAEVIAPLALRNVNLKHCSYVLTCKLPLPVPSLSIS
jgi:elongation of very long chain fatty acids protein 6